MGPRSGGQALGLPALWTRDRKRRAGLLGTSAEDPIVAIRHGEPPREADRVGGAPHGGSGARRGVDDAGRINEPERQDDVL